MSNHNTLFNQLSNAISSRRLFSAVVINDKRYSWTYDEFSECFSDNCREFLENKGLDVDSIEADTGATNYVGDEFPDQYDSISDEVAEWYANNILDELEIETIETLVFDYSF